MHRIRPIASISSLCVLMGVAGGIVLGVVLSRNAGWLTPVPWAAYLSLLVLAVGSVSWLDSRRVARRAAEAWPLPADFGLEEEKALAKSALPAKAQIDAAVDVAEPVTAVDSAEASVQDPAAPQVNGEEVPAGLQQPDDLVGVEVAGSGGVGGGASLNGTD